MEWKQRKIFSFMLLMICKCTHIEIHRILNIAIAQSSWVFYAENQNVRKFDYNVL